MARPPVALGTGGMAAAIVVAPQVAKLISNLLRNCLHKHNTCNDFFTPYVANLKGPTNN